MNITNIIQNFIDSQNASGSNFAGGLTNHVTLGVVVDVDDPLQQGRIRAFCPTLNDDVKQAQYVPWALFASPFSGMVDNSTFARGNGSGPETTSGSVHYGFWAIPEVGSHVLIMCIDGDFKRRVCIGCVPHHQKTQTINSGRFHWENGTVIGPLSGDDSPIEPLYTNSGIAFKDERDSAEWKSRVAEYQFTATRDDSGQVPNDVNNKSDQTIVDIIANEPKTWTHKMLGSHGYDWTGYKNLGAFLSPRAYGWSTPGMHSFSMDDRPFNNRMRFISATGHKIILDDVNERIYIATNKGNNYLEMDSCGNVDLFSGMKVSIHAADDINLTTDETFRVHAKKGIHMFAGEKLADQEQLDDIPNDGQIRFHAVDDIHVITEKTYRHLSKEDTLIEIGGKKCESVGDSIFLQVQNEINTITNTGDYNLTVSGNINDFIQGNSLRYALGSMKNMSEMDNHVYSFRNKIDIGAQKTIDVKSVGEDIVFEAVGKNDDKSGGVYLKSPKSFAFVSDTGMSIMSEEQLLVKTKKDSSIEADPTLDLSGISTDALMTSVSMFGASGHDMLDTTGFNGIDLAARTAYNAGFRNEELLIIIAIAGAETSYDPDFVEPTDGREDIWGDSVGMWKIRTVHDPENWTDINAKRIKDELLGHDSCNNNAAMAKLIYDDTNFSQWNSFCDGTYRNYLNEAHIAIDSMMQGMLHSVMFDQPEGITPYGFSLNDVLSCASSMASRSACSPNFSFSSNTSITIGVSGLNLQSQLDTAFKSIASNVQTRLADGIVSQINKNATALNKLQAKTLSFMDMFMTPLSNAAAIVGWIQDIQNFMSGSMNIDKMLMNAIGFTIPVSIQLDIGEFVPEFPWNALLGDICNFQMPNFDGQIWANFNLAGFDLCAKLDEITGKTGPTVR